MRSVRGVLAAGLTVFGTTRPGVSFAIPIAEKVSLHFGIDVALSRREEPLGPSSYAFVEARAGARHSFGADAFSGFFAGADLALSLRGVESVVSSSTWGFGFGLIPHGGYAVHWSNRLYAEASLGLALGVERNITANRVFALSADISAGAAIGVTF
ncbi:MAG: hypothetical protein JNG84_12905 [Archangium sp.]|nr:hypothetical protein [Archangium sp.]